MNPHNPTLQDVHSTEQLFFEHMKRLSLRSFDYQCSDRWLPC